LEGFGNPDSYQSVAFMGTTNNRKYNYFAVGAALATMDGSNGVMDVYQLAFNDSGAIDTVSLVNSYNPCAGWGNVESLAMDPDGVHLYVGCANYVAGGANIFNNSNKYSTGFFQLVVATLNTDGSVSWGNPVSGLFPGMIQGLTVGLWLQGNQTPVIFPTMRSYPPNSPQLQNTGHLSNGGVLVSGGLIGVIENTEASNGTPVNVGIFCSQGHCEQAFSMALYDKNSFSVMTAAELGMDCGPCNSAVPLQTSPALYWNQVQGGWKAEGIDYQAPTVNWGSNLLPSCTSTQWPITSCDTSYNNLNWSLDSKDINTLLFTPAPANYPGNYSYGILTIGTYNDGYIAYHNPGQNNSDALQLFSGTGNITTTMSDANGNVMFSTGSSGLFLYNMFYGSSTATLSNTTLIPNAADAPPPTNNINVLKVAFWLVDNFVIGSSAPPGEFNSGKPAPLPWWAMTLQGPLNDGDGNYHGQFLYNEDQLTAMGLMKGDKLRGLRLRSAQGITPSIDAVKAFGKFTIALSQGKTTGEGNNIGMKFTKNIGKKRKIVKNGALLLQGKNFPKNETSRGNSEEGSFAKTMWFDVPYLYRGGNLLLDVRHGKSSNDLPFMIDAMPTLDIQGVYKSAGSKTKTLQGVPALEFVY
jgi:hypothetical protein